MGLTFLNISFQKKNGYSLTKIVALSAPLSYENLNVGTVMGNRLSLKSS